jgi:hypothetical protein
MDITNELARIQQSLKAPKGQYNSFGKYPYRSCEDILEAVKPLLGACTLIVSDTMEQVGDRTYVKATAILHFGKDHASATAYAREPLAKKGMDEAQITGATSSYARKYALNGLFCIDDNKDADTQAPQQQQEQPKASPKSNPDFDRASKLLVDKQESLSKDQVDWCNAQIADGNSKAVIDVLKGM